MAYDTYPSFEALRAAILDSGYQPSEKALQSLKALRAALKSTPKEQLGEQAMFIDAQKAVVTLISACHVMECSLDELIAMIPFNTEDDT